MTDKVIARRYARALFAVASKKGAADVAAFGRDLDAIVEGVKASPALQALFRSPVFSAEEKKGVLDKVLAQINPNPSVKNFCHLLADKDRLAVLTDIAEVFAAMRDEAEGVVRGSLITAVALAEGRQGDLKAKLEKQTGRKLILDYAVDPAIIGGVVLKVGDKVMDASIRAQINILKENIKRGE